MNKSSFKNPRKRLSLASKNWFRPANGVRSTRSLVEIHNSSCLLPMSRNQRSNSKPPFLRGFGRKTTVRAFDLDPYVRYKSNRSNMIHQKGNGKKNVMLLTSKWRVVPPTTMQQCAEVLQWHHNWVCYLVGLSCLADSNVGDSNSEELIWGTGMRNW